MKGLPVARFWCIFQVIIVYNCDRGCPGFDWCGSGYRLQVERPSPDWAKQLTANNDSYNYALAA